jgi:site-specific DNA recombinase
MRVTEATKRKIVAAYLRVSSDEQRENQTIKTQEDAIRRYAEMLGLEIFHWYRDDGVSGTVPMAQRPAGKILLADAARACFGEVLVFKIDRLGRDDLDPIVVWMQLERFHVSVRSVIEGVSTIFEYHIRVAMSAEERRGLLARSKAGMDRAAREGRYLGGIVPLGYRVEGKNPRARLVPSDKPMWGQLSEADVVRRIYHWVAVDGWNTFQIAAELNALGVPTVYQKDGRGIRSRRTQQVWRPNRIYGLLTNTIYRGESQYGRHSKGPREVISAPALRLVPDEIWYAAQAALKRHSFNPEGKKRFYLLRSVMVCNRCGLHYAGATSPGRDAIYRCNGQLSSRRREGSRCPGKVIRCAWLDDLVWADIEAFLRNPGDIAQELANEMNQATDGAVTEAERTVLEARLNDLAGQRARALDSHVRFGMSESELEETLRRIENDHREVARRIDMLAGESTTDNGDVPTPEVLWELSERLDAGLTETQRQEIVRILVRQITVETTVISTRNKTAKITIEYRSPCVVESHTGSR